MTMIRQTIRFDKPGESWPLALTGASEEAVSLRIRVSEDVALLALRGLSQQIGEIGCRHVFVTVIDDQKTSRTVRAMPARGGYFSLLAVNAGEIEVHITGAEKADYLSIRAVGQRSAADPAGPAEHPDEGEKVADIDALAHACAGRLREGNTDSVIRSLQHLPSSTARTVVSQILCELADEPGGVPDDAPLFLQILAER